jgi:hypothetical protein
MPNPRRRAEAFGERVGGAMRLMQPRHICRLIGHRCESYIGPRGVRRSYATASAQRTE